MAIVAEALRSGTTNMLSTLRPSRKAPQRPAWMKRNRLVNRMTQRFEPRHSPVVPVVIAVTATAMGLALGGLVLRRYLTTTMESEERAETADMAE